MLNTLYFILMLFKCLWLIFPFRFFFRILNIKSQLKVYSAVFISTPVNYQFSFGFTISYPKLPATFNLQKWRAAKYLLKSNYVLHKAVSTALNFKHSRSNAPLQLAKQINILLNYYPSTFARNLQHQNQNWAIKILAVQTFPDKKRLSPHN